MTQVARRASRALGIVMDSLSFDSLSGFVNNKTGW
jgi:hypothetical protein